MKIKNYFFFSLLILLSINLIFYLITKNNAWASDDFPYIFGSKLYNLIQDKLFFFENHPNRFIPAFILINQFIPDNYSTWHLIVVSLYFCTSLIIYSVVFKLFKNSIYSLLVSILFTINFSISLDSLSWGIFYSHILNIFLGLISLNILFSIYTENKKLKKIYYICAYLLVLFVNVSISEGGLIYILINIFFFIFFINREKNYKILPNILFVSLPLIFFFIMNLFLFSNPVNILTERASANYQKKYIDKFKEETNQIYFYKSTYSPRNIKGYFFKLSDNILKSINLSQLENIIKDNKNFNFNKEKNFLKKNYYKIIFIFFFIFLIFLIYIILLMKKKNIINSYKILFLFYLLVLFVYTFVYARTNLSLALGFASSLLISKIIIDLWKFKKNFLSIFIFLIFLLPTVLAVSTKFNVYGDFNATQNLNNFEKINKATKMNNEIFFKKNEESKFYFYYKNYEKYKENLHVKYKNLSYFEFLNQFKFVN